MGQPPPPLFKERHKKRANLQEEAFDLEKRKIQIMEDGLKK
jgi:hypothetical protein